MLRQILTTLTSRLTAASIESGPSESSPSGEIKHSPSLTQNLEKKVPNVSKLADIPLNPLNPKAKFVFLKCGEQEFEEESQRPAHTLPPELEKSAIPFDQLDFVSDETPNSAMIDFGSYSAIYGAKLNGEEVAVKFHLHKSLTRGTDDRRYFPLFLHEASIMNSFKSSQKSRYFVDFKAVTYRPDVGYGIVMKRYPQSLFIFLKNNKENITLELMFKWAWQICTAIAEMHNKHLLHKDIKSKNIFLGEDLDAVVADLDQVASDYTPGTVLGTNAYLSPELKGVSTYPKENVTSCDIYSLGVVLWEIATGKVPSSYTDKDIPKETNEIFKQWISACWKKPEERPTAKMLEDAFKSAYMSVKKVEEVSAEEKSPDSNLSSATTLPQKDLSRSIREKEIISPLSMFKPQKKVCFNLSFDERKYERF